MQTAYIALGANISSPAGSPRETLDAAIQHLAELGQVAARSSYYSTEPVGYADQPTFLNAAVALQTPLDPRTLLDRLLEIERSFGRDRSHGIPNGPGTQDLQLPHPRMAQRAFVLVPLAEIAPGQIHPQLQKTVSQLLQDLSR